MRLQLTWEHKYKHNETFATSMRSYESRFGLRLKETLTISVWNSENGYGFSIDQIWKYVWILEAMSETG